MFIPEWQSSIVLPGLRTEDTCITDLSYFVSSLFVNSGNWPELIEYECVWCFKGKINARLGASRWECDVGEDGGWESVSREIVYQWIIKFERWERIAYRQTRVIELNDLKLPHEGRKFPFFLVEDRAKLIGEADVGLRSCIDVGIIGNIGLECGDIDLKRLLITKIRQLISPY